ncbi:MAG: TetR/AcrR family transcriptional regulator [Bacteroidaceae bacterium]|nr:TetR/AcrR family transcriptional regulator [Bacteroidaceae bacterium]
MIKTRNHLVDTARILFAKNGFEATTMNDIAAASGKGRRTLYTYFSSKEEIYVAVIQSELERLSDQMEEVARQEMTPEKKMAKLFFAHLEFVKETVYRNGNLRAEFFRDIWKVESVRKNFDRNEIILFRRVMNEGNDRGVFDIRNVKLMARITHYCLKGCEVPYIFGRFGVASPEELYPYIFRMVTRMYGADHDKDHFMY